jgi:hypothetical protein
MNSDKFNDPNESKAYCEGRRLAAASGIVAPAEATTGNTTDENGLTWTTNRVGRGGQVVVLKDPGVNNATLSFGSTDNRIEISLATGAGGAITTTSTQILEMLNVVDTCVICNHTIGSLGTGVVEEETATLGVGSNPHENASDQAIAFAAGEASWIADPSGEGAPAYGRDECALPYGGGFGGLFVGLQPGPGGRRGHLPA